MGSVAAQPCRGSLPGFITTEPESSYHPEIKYKKPQCQYNLYQEYDTPFLRSVSERERASGQEREGEKPERRKTTR
eukprot:408956-Rhodomonas_salina.1